MPRETGAATTSAQLRAHNLARLLRAIHDGGGRDTRAGLTRELNLARGTATVLVRELAGRRLIEEVQAGNAHRARGRPTGIPSAHPQGPVVLALDLRDDSFTTAAFELTGRGSVLERQERGDRSGTTMLGDAAKVLGMHSEHYGARVVGIGVAVPSPVSGGKMAQPEVADWREIDVADALAPAGGIVLSGNDATLAGVAEARRGALRGTGVALHVHAATGIGGVLLTGGEPALGAHGAAGEFGHMPLAGADRPCRCGSAGCWELEAGARGLLREAGLPEEGDRMLRAAQVIANPGADPAAAKALRYAAKALGQGIGALVNAHDPAVIGLSGLAADMYRAAPDVVMDAYLSRLMRFRRDRPPELLPSVLGDLGPLTGAAELVFGSFLTPRGLEGW